MHSPNQRVLKIGNLVARGSLSPDGQAKYYAVAIGSSDEPFGNNRPFSIRTGGEGVLKSSEFTHARISRLVAEESDAMPVGDDSHVFAYGYSFHFHGSELQSFQANVITLPDKSYHPEIGEAGGEVFYPLPISENRLIALFGEPEERRDVFQW